MDSPPQRLRRAANACQRCRSRKVKCSGSHPCDKCQHRNVECVFEDDKKILVSEELFQSMKRRLSELEAQPPIIDGDSRKRARSSHEQSIASTIQEGRSPNTPREPTPAQTIHAYQTGTVTVFANNGRDDDDRFVSNPLVSPSTYVKNVGPRQRTWLLLAPTSTWSFSRRVLTAIRERVSQDSPKSVPVAPDGDAYQLHWSHASSEEPPDISGLPPIDYAIYMLNTVKFHLGQLYRLFDEEEFLRNLYEFYDDAAGKVQEARLWYIQYLLILAFGEAFLTPVRTTGNEHVWSRYFTRAMSMLPDITGLWQDPVLAIEVLSLIALYFHSVDMRDSAYCYIGHAMRMALVEGYHRALPVEQLGEKLVERGSNIWWTVYILDRKFSALIGSPNSVNDEDITAILRDPRTCSQRTAALSLNVKITQVTSRVLSTVYSVDGTLGGEFLKRVRSVLHEVADLSRELQDVFAHRFKSSVDALSGVITRLTLSCHACIIVTVRPLILSLLWEKINCFEAGDTPRTLSPPVQTLMQSCIDSASKSLRILIALRDQNLLETFLPFDLENAFSATFILVLLSIVLPDLLLDQSYKDLGLSILNEMISRGNRVAQLRKLEVELLEEFAQPLYERHPRREIRRPDPHEHETQAQHVVTPTSTDGSNLVSTGFPNTTRAYSLDVEGAAHTLASAAAVQATTQEDDFSMFDWRDLGLSMNHMLSAADQLNAHSLVDADPDGIRGDLWLWSSK